VWPEVTTQKCTGKDSWPFNGTTKSKTIPKIQTHIYNKGFNNKIGKHCEACTAIINRKSVKYQSLKPTLGLTMSEQEDEYQYFHVFAEKTEDLTARKKYCPWDSSLTLEDCCALMTCTLELADITLSRSHDIDGIRGKAASPKT
jgi:hypothetical protein